MFDFIINVAVILLLVFYVVVAVASLVLFAMTGNILSLFVFIGLIAVLFFTLDKGGNNYV